MSESTNNDFSVAGARAAAARDELGQWVAEFLASDGSDNLELGRELRQQKEHWHGPVRLPFDQLHRLAGPPDQPTLERLTEDDLETVEGMEESIEDGWDPPPLVVSFENDQLVLEDGNHRVEGLRRAGAEDYWCVVGFDDASDRARFRTASVA